MARKLIQDLLNTIGDCLRDEFHNDSYESEVLHAFARHLDIFEHPRERVYMQKVYERECRALLKSLDPVYLSEGAFVGSDLPADMQRRFHQSASKVDRRLRMTLGRWALVDGPTNRTTKRKCVAMIRQLRSWGLCDADAKNLRAALDLICACDRGS